LRSSARSAERLEGWQRARSLWPSFETAVRCSERPPQDDGIVCCTFRDCLLPLKSCSHMSEYGALLYHLKLFLTRPDTSSYRSLGTITRAPGCPSHGRHKGRRHLHTTDEGE